MATYPATNTIQASELLVDVSNQMHEIVNEDAVTEITTESGTVPSVRKALADTFLFVEPVAWDSGNNETAFNQLRTFGDETYWAPTATLTNPIAMGATPVGDNNWRLAPTGKNSSIVQQWDTTAQEELLPTGSKIYPEIGTLSDGDTVPAGTTHLRALVGGNEKIVLMLPASSGLVSNLTEKSATVGATEVTFITKAKKKKYDASEIGCVYNSASDAQENTERIAFAASAGLKIGVSDVLHLGGTPVNVLSGLLSIKQSGGGSLVVEGPCFVVGDIDRVDFSSLPISTVPSSPVEVVTSIAGAKVDVFRVYDCDISGAPRFSYVYDDAIDPSVTEVGYRNVYVLNNRYENQLVSHFSFPSMPYNQMRIKGNVIKNMRFLWLNDGIFNTSTYKKNIQLEKRYLDIRENVVVNDDNFDGMPTSSSYLAFALTEGKVSRYADNHVEGLHSTFDSGVYDFYASSLECYRSGNVWKNNLSTEPTSLLNTLLKTKDSNIFECHNDKFYFDEDYFTRIGEDGSSVSFQIHESTRANKQKLSITSCEMQVWRYKDSIGSIEVEDFSFEDNDVLFMNNPLTSVTIHYVRPGLESGVTSTEQRGVSIHKNRYKNLEDNLSEALTYTLYRAPNVVGVNDYGDLGITINRFESTTSVSLTRFEVAGAATQSHRDVTLLNNNVVSKYRSSLSWTQSNISRARSFVSKGNTYQQSENLPVTSRFGSFPVLCAGVQIDDSIRYEGSNLGYVVNFQPQSLTVASTKDYDFVLEADIYSGNSTLTKIQTTFTVQEVSGTNQLNLIFTDSLDVVQTYDITNVVGVATNMKQVNLSGEIGSAGDYFRVLNAGSNFYIAINSPDGSTKLRTAKIRLTSI